MTRSPSPKMKNLKKTTSAETGGGCFSLLVFPPVMIAAVVGFMLLMFGETSNPIEMARSVSADSVDHLSPVFTDEVMYWEDAIIRWAAEWDLDPNMAATVMQIESCGDPLAKSPAGAMGLFQVMPYHFTQTEQPYLPHTNARRGLAYLRESMDTFYDPRSVFAGYNGGISNATKAEYYWPEETIRYADWGNNIYKDASKGKDFSPALEEWLAHGGASLCAEAREHLGFSR